jgi:predicted amidohydrolase YtcJ
MYRAEPDLLLTGGRFVTLDPAGRIAGALAVREGRIAALGDGDELHALAGPATQVMDLGGRTVIPGIVDSHCHPDGAAARLSRWHNLEPARITSRSSLLDYIGAESRAMAPESWFAGYRFNERKSGGYPTRRELDDATGTRPLFILRTDGHLGLVNSAALAALEIDDKTPDPPFGAFDRDPVSGEMTGLVREAAAQLFAERIHADDSVDDLVTGLQEVFDEFLGYGITSVYNSLTSSKAIQAYQRMKEQGQGAGPAEDARRHHRQRARGGLGGVPDPGRHSLGVR